jgi:hypothetical protein
MMLRKAILLVIDGMDVVNFTLADTPVMGGWHGRTAVGVAHTEIIGAGTTITPVAHGMMGTGQNVIALRPGLETTGRPYTYEGTKAVTIGDAARSLGIPTAAVGKNEAAIVLGGTDMVEISRLERNGVDATDADLIARETLGVLAAMPDRGLVVVNYNGVDSAAHRRDVLATIAAVQAADRMVGQIIRATDLGRTLVVIAADHGTNPLTGRHNPVPTPLVLVTECIVGRAHLGVHNLEIAVTIAAALGLNLPAAALGRDLLALAVAGSTTGDYRQTLDNQFTAYLASQSKRHLMAHED